MTTDKIKTFVKDNFKIIVTIAAFLVTMYVQHLTNTTRISRLEEQSAALELALKDQYDRIDAIKLDKAVYEAGLAQFASIQTDLREMRYDIKELLKNRQ